MSWQYRGKVFVVETLMSQRMRQCQLTDIQYDLVIGSLLGDGYLVKTTSGYAFRINHGLNQGLYVDWKYDILQPFVRTKPKISDRCYYFRTITHSSFIDLRYCFYKGCEKVIPTVLL